MSTDGANSISQHLEHHEQEPDQYWFRKTSGPVGGFQIILKDTQGKPTPPSRFLDKVAIVTESADGIGFSTAVRLALEGACVVITSGNRLSLGEAAEKLKCEELNVTPIVCDVSSAQGRKDLLNQTLEKYKKINVLISNATAPNHISPVSEAEGNVHDKLREVNVETHYLLFKDVVPHMEKGSSIVFVSSTASRLSDAAAMVARKATKTVLTELTKDLSKDLNPENVRINSVVTGFEQPRKHSLKDFLRRLRKSPPDRIENTKEVDQIAFLASYEAFNISGQTFEIRGGTQSKL